MKSRLAAILGLAALIALLASSCVTPTNLPSNTAVIASGGFGDPANSYAWSMASFKGKLYVGTAKYTLCVERATSAHYFGPAQYFSDSSASCPANPDDMDLRAQIWQYTPETGLWAKVHESTTVVNPSNPAKQIARDIGYRGMTVVGDTLYVGAVSANEFQPGLNAYSPPEILTTTDGTTFTGHDVVLPDQNPAANPPAVYGTVHTPFGYQKPMGTRAMTNVNGSLFITSTGGLTGDGAVVQVGGLGTPNLTFSQVSPANMLAYELESFAGQLWVGTGDKNTGYGVYRGSTWTSPMTFLPVVTGGGGRGAAMTSVVSMGVFNNQLYVGPSGWYAGVLPASELIRISADNSWELVVGASRTVGTKLVSPISGLSDGFGNIANAHFWRMLNHGNGLYVGTNDWTWTLATIPGFENVFFSWEYGFDVYGTCDGKFWWGMTRTAFNTSGHNFGARTMGELNGKAYFGSANHFDGTTIYQNNDVSPCPAPITGGSTLTAGIGESAAGTSSTVPKGVPGRLLADPEVCGTVLSWDPQAGEQRYVIKRAAKESRQVAAPVRPADQGPGVPDSPPIAGTTPATISTLGEYETVGVTTNATFVDRNADPTKEYTYQVSSDASNGTGAVAIAQVPARAAGTSEVTATDEARKASGLDVEALRTQRGVESTPDACSK